MDTPGRWREPPGPPDRADRARRLGRFAPALLPALAMLLAGGVGLRRPSLGWDENATLIVARRTVPQIVDLAGNFDGSIAPYYLFMHFWTAIFGTSEIALRAPSLLAMAAGVGVAGELGRRLFTPTVGLVGGLLLAAVPAMSRYAQDARVYGIAFLMVMLSTLLLHRAVARPTWSRWLCYGATVVLVGAAHLLGLTMLAGHALVVANRWRARRDRRQARAVVVTVTALALLAPLALLGLGQRGRQLAWIDPVTLSSVAQAPGALFGAATVAGLAIGHACLARWPHRWRLVELAVLAAVPPVVLLAVSFLTDPLWVPRYVLFTLAPIALLAAVAVHGRRASAAVLLAVVVVLGAPAQQQLRGPASHHGPDFRRLAAIVSEHERPGDGIVYGGPSNWSLRAGLDYYLRGKPAPRDLLRYRPAAEVGALGAQECPDTAACVGDTARIWLVRLYRQDDPLRDAGRIEPILRGGYRRVDVWGVTKGTVALYERLPDR